MYNTASVDLRGFDLVPRGDRIPPGANEVSGHDVDANNELAAELAERDNQQLLRNTNSASTSMADALLALADLGGGTGSGMAPMLTKHLNRVYKRSIYGADILPATDEDALYSHSATRSFKALVGVTDHVFTFDNGTWTESGEDVARIRDTTNKVLVRRLGILSTSGEIAKSGTVTKSVVNSSEIVNTFRSGGISTADYAASEPPENNNDGGFSIKGLLGGGSPSMDELDSINCTTTQTRKAMLEQFTLPCDVDSASHGLVVVNGPPEWFSRKAVERSRTWVKEQTRNMEVRGGNYPLSELNHVSVLALLNDVPRSDRVTEIRSTAVEARQNRREQIVSDAADCEDGTEAVVNDRLDSLF